LSSAASSPKMVSSFDIYVNGVKKRSVYGSDHVVMTPNPNGSIQLKNIKGCISGTSPDTDTKSSIGVTRLDFKITLR